MSIAGSIAGLASVGFSVAKGLYQMADDMSVAGVEVRLYGNEIDAFAKLLLHVQRTVDGLACSAQELKEIKTQVQEILKNCDRILQPLQQVQQALLPLLQRFRDSPSKMLQVALRARWTFVSRGKVLFYRELLQRQHQLLDTHLATVTLISLQGKKEPQMVQYVPTRLAKTSLERQADRHMQDATQLPRELVDGTEQHHRHPVWWADARPSAAAARLRLRHRTWSLAVCWSNRAASFGPFVCSPLPERR